MLVFSRGGPLLALVVFILGGFVLSLLREHFTMFWEDGLVTGWVLCGVGYLALFIVCAVIMKNVFKAMVNDFKAFRTITKRQKEEQ